MPSYHKPGGIPIVAAQFLAPDEANIEGPPIVTIAADSITPVPAYGEAQPATVPAYGSAQPAENPTHAGAQPTTVPGIPPSQQQQQNSDTRVNGCWVIGGSVACAAGICCCLCCVLPLAVFILVYFLAMDTSTQMATGVYDDDFNNFNDDFYNT